MTPDDKRRLAEIRKGCGLYREDECGKSSEIGVALFLLRLLDEATAERDAAIEALRPFAIAADDLDEKTRDNSVIWETPAAMGIEAKDLRKAKAVLAAHSAATKQADPVEKAVSDG